MSRYQPNYVVQIRQKLSWGGLTILLTAGSLCLSCHSFSSLLRFSNAAFCRIEKNNVNYTVSQKNVSLFIFVISLSDFIQFCQFLPERYPMKFETNTLHAQFIYGFMRSYCTL